MLNSSSCLTAEAVSSSSVEQRSPLRSIREKFPKVLVVDDDVDNLMLMSYVLEQFECSLFCETDGRAALDLIWKLKPDLIVLDIRLPGLSGLEMARSVRLHKDTCNIPIVVVTALASASYKARSIQAGCSKYISKPYLLEDMETLIGSYLNPVSR